MHPEKRKEWLLIPNLLCYLRLLLLPVFAMLYCYEEYVWATVTVLFSAFTDVADGFIARKYKMISELGKILDPLADKLTQAVVSACLLLRYPVMWVLFSIIIVKESFQGIGGLLIYRKMRKMRSSEWFGKLSTFMFYTVMAYLVLFCPDPSFWKVTLPVLVSSALMLLALILYGYRFFQMSASLKEAPTDPTPAE